MPLVKRLVEPVYIARSELSKQVKNELEGVTVNSLAGVIKQLSSISKHAENLFGDLVNEASAIYQRSSQLSQRVQVLYEKTSQLDSAVKEDVKVEEFSLMTHYKSRRQEEQQVLNPNTLPQALLEVYKSCDQPPALSKFTPYRDDGKEGLKFYTDRNYFYDLWVQQQTQLIKERKKREKKKRRRRDNQPTKKVRVVQKKKFAAVDAEFVTGDMNRVTETNAPLQVETTPTHAASAAQENRPISGPPPPPPPAPPEPQQPSQAALSAPTVPPPPPPPVPMVGGNVPPPPPPPMSHSPALPHAAPPTAYPGYAAPPPPPPAPPAPPAPLMAGGPPPPPPPPAPSGPAAPPPPPMPSMVAPPPPPPPGPAPPVAAPATIKAPEPDPRKDLLTAIMMGKKLRKVEHKDEVKKQEYGTDVASILKRRIVMEVSDSSDDSGSETDDSGWSD